MSDRTDSGKDTPKVISGNLVDHVLRSIYPARIHVDGEKISRVEKIERADNFILPGFVDAHIHIESSLLIPSEFARLAVIHGTVATVSDPHEIGNVMGIEGVTFMIENGKKVPLKFYFGAPSCVPATKFETAGAEIGVEEVQQLLQNPEIKYLSEMMNWPGVLNGDKEVIEKIEVARRLGKPVDGHAPGLMGEQTRDYIAAGISTDHECFTYEEARHKMDLGMKIIIREGSAAKNFDALWPLIDQNPDMIMFCSDDKHPDSLLTGHINELATRAAANGCDVFNILNASSTNAIEHYNLDVGLLQEGNPADMVVVSDLNHYKVVETWIDGEVVASNGKSLIGSQPSSPLNKFHQVTLKPSDLAVSANNHSAGDIRVIEAIDHQLITTEKLLSALITENVIKPDPSRDILKLTVVNRYNQEPPSTAFVTSFGIKEGAIASSVAHDSHNVIAVGSSDELLTEAINLISDHEGGLCVVNNNEKRILPLPYAGLMSGEDGFDVADSYIALDKMVKDMGCPLSAPFMTLSFMALLVIPDVKLSDKGLFNGVEFKFTDLFIPG